MSNRLNLEGLVTVKRETSTNLKNWFYYWSENLEFASF